MSYSAPVTRHMQQTNPIYGLACVYARPFFFKGDCFQTKVFRIAPESNGSALGCACVAAHRTCIWACQGHDPLFLWLRWVEVSPKRFSLPSLLTHSDRCTCPFGQMAKFCLILFCSHRRERDGRGDFHSESCDFRRILVRPVVSLSCVA